MVEYRCDLCEYTRSQNGSRAVNLHFDLCAREGWIISSWGTICGQCVRQHKSELSTWSLLELVQRKALTRKVIRQKGANDCGLAAVAMALGVSYETVEEMMPPERRRDTLGYRLANYDIFEILYRFDKMLQYVMRWDRLGLRDAEGHSPTREPWPPEPWAPSHIVQIPGHWMAMDRQGRILDPAGVHTKLTEDATLVIGVFDRC